MDCGIFIVMLILNCSKQWQSLASLLYLDTFELMTRMSSTLLDPVAALLKGSKLYNMPYRPCSTIGVCSLSDKKKPYRFDWILASARHAGWLLTLQSDKPHNRPQAKSRGVRSCLSEPEGVDSIPPIWWAAFDKTNGTPCPRTTLFSSLSVMGRRELVN